MACLTSALAHVVRVLARPRGARARAVDAAEPPSRARLAVLFIVRRALIITLPALEGDENASPYAFSAVVSITVIGLYIAYVMPIFLRWRMGDAFQPGPVDARQEVQVDQPGRDRSGSRSAWSSSSCRSPRPACRGVTSSTGRRSTTRRSRSAALLAGRRHLVAGERAPHVHRPDPQTRVRRGRRDRGRDPARACRVASNAWTADLPSSGSQPRSNALAGACGIRRRMLLPRVYVDAVQRAGGHRRAAPARPAPRATTPTVARPARRPLLAGGADIDPAVYGAEPDPQTMGTVPERDAFEIALAARRDGARPAAARRLPRHAGDERGPRRDADPASARRRRPRGPPALARHVRQRRPRRAAARRLAGRARRRARTSTRRSPTTTRAWTASARASRSPAGRRSTTCPRRSRTRRCRFALGVQWHPEADPTRT